MVMPHDAQLYGWAFSFTIPPAPAGVDLSLSPGDMAAQRCKQYIDIYIQSFVWTLGTNFLSRFQQSGQVVI
jgi:hypothetical protein